MKRKGKLATNAEIFRERLHLFSAISVYIDEGALFGGTHKKASKQ